MKIQQNNKNKIEGVYMETLIKKAKELKSKIRALKTNKAINKAVKELEEVEVELFRLLDSECDKYGEFSIKGIVRSCYNEIVVDTSYGVMFLNMSNDVLSKSWYDSTCCMEYSEGMELFINCRVEVDYNSYRLSIVVGKHSGGVVDLNRYNKLVNGPDKLAFFQYPDGMSGLMA